MNKTDYPKPNTNRRFAFVALLSLLVLSGCAAHELPDDLEGSDEMKKSPCACYQLEYKPGGASWQKV